MATQMLYRSVNPWPTLLLLRPLLTSCILPKRSSVSIFHEKLHVLSVIPVLRCDDGDSVRAPKSRHRRCYSAKDAVVVAKDDKYGNKQIISVTSQLYEYLLINVREPEILKKLREETATMRGSQMQVSPDQAQLLAMLVQILGAKRCIEVGVYTVLDMHGGLNSIPHDIITDILARVASYSATDLFNVKITCKDLNKAGDDKHVYQRISMDGFRLVPWKSSEEAFSSFLRRCEESGNSEALFKRGMFKYFSSQQLEEGREMLRTAANLGHEASTYVLGIILMGNNDQSIRDHGMKLLSKISSGRSRIIRHCRKKSEKIVHRLWRTDDSLHPREHLMCDCNKRYQKRGGWSSSDDENEEVFNCEACKWNHELQRFCKMLRGN